MSKRIKTHDFKSYAEAEAYLNEVTQGLPPDLWVRILSQNTSLNVRDIRRMCSVNRTFRALCQDGTIWKEMAKHEFGLDEYRQIASDIETDAWYLSQGLTLEQVWMYQLLSHRAMHKNRDMPDAVWSLYTRDAVVRLGKSDGILHIALENDTNPAISYALEEALDDAFTVLSTMQWNGHVIKALPVSSNAPMVARRVPFYLIKMEYEEIGSIFQVFTQLFRSEQNPANIMSLCFACDQPATHRCKACKVAEYCSAECQRDDWHDNHHLVCFQVDQPDLDHVHDLIAMMFEPETEQHLKQVVQTHQTDPKVMAGIAGLLQATFDDQEPPEGLIGDRESRRERRRAKRRRRWAKKKHSVLRHVPGTRAYRARRRYRRYGAEYGPYGAETPEQFEAERSGYY